MSNENLHNIIQDVHSHGINPYNREIYLHGYIDNVDEEPLMDYRMAVSFHKNLTLLDRINSKPIVVHMHSIGGEWNSGMAIYDAIRFVQSPVVIIAYSQAASMSSIVLQAADLRLLHRNAAFMIHYGYVGMEDNYISAKSSMEFFERTNTTMLDIYVERCMGGPYFEGWTEKKVRTFLDRKMKDKQEWYLSAEEAVNHGFADGIIGVDYDWNDIIRGKDIDVEKKDTNF